jgi:hypothetical protein
MAKFEIGFANQKTNADSNLDIFEQTPSTSEQKNLSLKNCYFLDVTK